eukprot:GHVL01019841.1.p1 GENE.GHVL01019841.1~~GHVL01019841.1.p1  ORF type:complete len:369 (+),score=66.39 GHVL01019841.1:54-1160(+)
MSAEHQEYIALKINPILESLVTQLLLDRPKEPIPFMIRWLSDQNRGNIENSDDDDDDDDDADVVDDLPPMQPNSLQSRHRCSVSAEAYGDWNKKQTNFKPPVHNKSEEQRKRLQAIMEPCFLFSNLGDREMNQVVDAMVEVAIKSGERIIEQGNDGDVLYIVEKGTLECLKKDPNDEEKVVKILSEGDVFGELALLYNTPRAASVVCKEECTAWRLDRETFNYIVKEASISRREMYEKFLSSVPLFKTMDNYERSKLADCLKSHSFNSGDHIVTQGDMGDCFFILEEGNAEATKTLVSGQNPVTVMEYNAGDYFGELALLRNEPRAANIVAKGDVKVASLDRRSFKRLLGPLEDILTRNSDKYVNIVV